MFLQVNSDLEEANNLAMKAAESVKEQRLSRDLEIQRRLNLRNHGDTISITSSQSLPVTHNVNGHVMSNSGSHGVSGHGNNINNTTSPFGSHSHHPHFGNHFATSGGAGIPGNAVGTPSSPSVTPQTPPTSSTTSSRRVSPMSITSSSSVGMGGAQISQISIPPGGGVNVSTPPSATSSPSPGGQPAMTNTPSPRITPGNAPPSYPIKTSPGSVSAPGTFQAYETSTSHRDATQRHDVTSLDQTSQVDDSVDEFTRVSPCVSRHAFATNSPKIFRSQHTMWVAQNYVFLGKNLLKLFAKTKITFVRWRYTSPALFFSSKNTRFWATLYPTTPFVL